MRTMISRNGLAATMLVGFLALGAPAAVAQSDPIVEQARTQGLVGEQPDGFIGFVTDGVSADVRARVNQINIRRRAAYTERAAANGASASEMAAAVACQIYASRIAVGEYYRDEAGAWRQRTAAQPIPRLSFCAP
ncbi:MAG: YdbL family protein [Hyphomonadaceae bacterium]